MKIHRMLFRILFVVLACGLTGVRAEEPGVRVLSDLAYKSGADLSEYERSRCRLDLYLPAAGGKGFPTMVWFHGGALTGGSKDGKETVAAARRFAEKGVGVAAVNYRLSPKAVYPAYVEDAAAAFAWVKRTITEQGGDAGKVFVGGHSAGGYLALMVGLDESRLKAVGWETTAVAGVIPVAGQTLTHYTIRAERGIPKTQLLADEGSPIFHVRGDGPPMLILYAEHDMALRAEENLLLAAGLRNAGAKNLTVHEVKDHDHGSVGNALGVPGDAGFELMLKFMLPEAP